MPNAAVIHAETDCKQDIRYNWTVEEILCVHDRPLLELIGDAARLHARHHVAGAIQKASLLSVKTGGCPEDCAYCPQSAHHQIGLEKTPLLPVEDVLAIARRAKDAGADRFCMGAAWREVRDGEDFDALIAMVRGVRSLGMEACVTLGMLTQDQARRLAEAGLTAYNHNLDTGPDYYPNIISTRSYDDRLDTLRAVRAAGIQMCCGGIIGMGESTRDRAAMLAVLSGFDPHPESVPINALVAVAGTPLEACENIDPLDFVRMIATTRIVLPASVVRLSAGRANLSREAQILCMVAGANSLFYGETLLTTPNAALSEDAALFASLAAIEPAKTVTKVQAG
jgi:biotin synthase